ALVRELRLADWKLIEIARALVTEASFVVLDEPTALLDRHDSETILRLVERLRESGVGVSFVSHRLDEALRVADRATVLRDGRLVTTLPATDLTQQRLVELIVGAKGLAASEEEPDEGEPPGRLALEIHTARAVPGGRPFDLSVREGEILGLTGLVGSGALEVARMLVGRSPLDGTLVVHGRERRIRTPADSIRAGIGYIPEDRASHGLVTQLSVALNVNLASLPAVSPAALVRYARVHERARRLAA